MGLFSESQESAVEEAEAKKNQVIERLEKIIEEAINLPKGVEPHSWSDYKSNKP